MYFRYLQARFTSVRVCYSQSKQRTFMEIFNLFSLFFAQKAVLSCHSASPANFFRIHLLLYELLCKSEKSVSLVVFYIIIKTTVKYKCLELTLTILSNSTVSYSVKVGIRFALLTFFLPISHQAEGVSYSEFGKHSRYERLMRKGQRG